MKRQHRIELEHMDGSIGAVVIFAFEKSAHEHEGVVRVEGPKAALVEAVLGRPGVSAYDPVHGSFVGHHPERWDWVRGVVKSLARPFCKKRPFAFCNITLNEEAANTVS